MTWPYRVSISRIRSYNFGDGKLYGVSSKDLGTRAVESALLRPRPAAMSDVTRILSAIEQGDPTAADQLLPLVYDELRRLAARKLARETPGQTLQTTALVHEAYLRLVG